MTSPRPVAGPAAFDRAQLEGLRHGLELLALRALGDRGAAEEVAQETLARAVIAAEHGTQVQDGKLAAFVAGIARHVIADRQREGARLAPLSAAAAVAAADPDPLARLLSADERASVHAALATLGGADRELLRLCYFEGRTPSEIADLLDEPPERIRKRKSRALDRLREAFTGASGHVPALHATEGVTRKLTPPEDTP